MTMYALHLFVFDFLDFVFYWVSGPADNLQHKKSA